MESGFFKVIVRLFTITAALTVSNSVRGEVILSAKEFEVEALNQNLDLRLKHLELKQAEARASGLQIPPPKIGISQMEMKGGGTAPGWQVSQVVPFPTKVSSDYRARQYAFDAEKSNLDAIIQETKGMARYLYFYVWVSQEQERILKGKESLLQQHLSGAQSLARSDTFAKVHLLKVESELDQIRSSLEEVSQDQNERMALTAQFLNKDPETFQFKAQDPGLSPVPQIDSIENTPHVQSARKQVKRFEALEREKKSEWLPDFNITYSHMEQTAMFPENNQISLGASLPFLFFWQPKSSSNQASAQRASAELKLEKTKRAIQADKVILEKNVESLKEQIAILSEKVLPRSLKRKRLFQNIAPRDLGSLQEQLDTYLSIPNVELQILALKSKYEQAIAELTKYKSIEGESND